MPALGAIKASVDRLDGVMEAHHLHAWTLTTGKKVVSMHVLARNPSVGGVLQTRRFPLLRDEFDVFFSTVQVETACLERDEAREIDATRSHGTTAEPGQRPDGGGPAP